MKKKSNKTIICDKLSFAHLLCELEYKRGAANHNQQYPIIYIFFYVNRHYLYQLLQYQRQQGD